MKNPLHYIQEYLHRTKQILVITNDQFRDLLSIAEMHHKLQKIKPAEAGYTQQNYEL
jgi:hypothetical protein